MKIAVAGTGHVGLSPATLLSQYHKVAAVDIMQETVNAVPTLHEWNKVKRSPNIILDWGEDAEANRAGDTHVWQES